MQTYWSQIENVISMFMCIVFMSVWRGRPYRRLLWARPGEALMWQRQSLRSAGLTLWCCGRDAEPVSTNPISITLTASYLWLRWPSALPPQIFSLAQTHTHSRSILPSKSLFTILSISISCIVSSLSFFCSFLPSNRSPRTIIMVQFWINRKKRRWQIWDSLWK